MKPMSSYAKKKGKPTNTLRFEIHLDVIADKKIIRRLNMISNRSQYIKELIAKDIESKQ